MPALDRITIRGFKSIKSIKCLALGRINVLIGPNGSGKSNFIDAFSLMRAISKGQLQSYVGRAGGAEKILHFGSRATRKITVEVSFDGGKSDYHVELSPTRDDSLYPDAEGGSGGNALESLMSGEGPWSQIRENITGWRRVPLPRYRYHFNDEKNIGFGR